MPTLHDGTSLVATPPRTPVKKEDLSPTVTPLAAQKTSGFSARVATISSNTARSSPSRGLTLKITDGMAQDQAKSIQSAPVRQIRRLPAPPVPQAPATSIERAPYAPCLYSSPPSAHTARAKRPLPKPPIASQVGSETLQQNNTTPPEEPRKVRPLPIPKPKLDDPPPVVNPPPRQICKSLPSQSKPPALPLLIPSPSVIASFPPLDAPSKRHPIHSSSAKLSKAAANSPRKLFPSRSFADLHRVDVVQLHRQLVLNRSPTRLSMDSDVTSDDDDDEGDMFPPAVIIQDAPKSRKGLSGVHGAEDNKSEHADYAWLLSNRILYNKSDGRVTSKWTREKNGKRYTEEDFGNIMHALRSL